MSCLQTEWLGAQILKFDGKSTCDSKVTMRHGQTIAAFDWRCHGSEMQSAEDCAESLLMKWLRHHLKNNQNHVSTV